MGPLSTYSIFDEVTEVIISSTMHGSKDLLQTTERHFSDGHLEKCPQKLKKSVNPEISY